MSSEESLNQLLVRMLRARRFCEKLIDHADLVRGAIIPTIGQEGTAAAVASCREGSDAVLVSHRNNHYLVSLGADLEMLYAEIFGRDRGPQRGRAGTMRLVSPENGVIWATAVVAGNVPLGVGVALALKRRGAGVVFCAFGDGALGEGVACESFNIARLNSLPVVFVCENNAPRTSDDLYATAPRAMLENAASRLTDIPAAYRIPTCSVDASRPRETAETLRAVVAEVRAGRGPMFIESKTVPWPIPMAGLVITKPDGDTDLATAWRPADLDSWSAADPVLNEVRDLLTRGVEPQAVLELDAQIRAEVEHAATSAANAPLAPPSAALEDVWDKA